MEAHATTIAQPFAAAREDFDRLIGRLGAREVRAMSHSQVEALLFAEGNEVLRKLYQGYLDSLGTGSATEPVRGPEGAERTHRRQAGRNLMVRFGLVRIEREGYGCREVSMAYPLDAQLNMPPHLYSFGLERLIAEEIAKASFAQAAATVERTTGAHVPKRQVEEIALRAAADFDAYYREVERAAAMGAAESGPILVITADGKGVVMRKEDLREATRKAAETREHKLTTRLSKGEKRNAKRMAEVAAVYTIEPHPRTAEEVIGQLRPVHAVPAAKRPRPEHKRTWASVAKDAAEVIEDAFQEALRRDPERKKRWVALVDGNKTQLKLIQEAAERHGVKLSIVVDFIHALEYLWKASRELLGDTSEAEDWVLERAMRVLNGEASLVAAAIRRSATKRGLAAKERKAIDDCADYLLDYAPFMRYDACLKDGLPIATGVIEGACRHLVKDRMDLTGARWGLKRAEAVLQLRALQASGDFDAYWAFHERQEFLRNHAAQYLAGKPPHVAIPTRPHRERNEKTGRSLRLVKS
jgi:hypothetical protein